MKEWYRIPMGGTETSRELLYAGNYNLLGPQTDEFIDSLTFGQKGGAYDDILVPFTFEPVDFYPRWPDILRELRKRKLRRPRPEHALRFGILYPEEQRVCPHIFPHKPWPGYNQKGFITILQGNHVGRRIDISPIGCPHTSGYIYFGLKPASK